MTRQHSRWLLGIVLLVYLGLAALFAVRIPDWQAPDEPAHYNYIRQVARGGRLPEIEPGDWDSAYLDQLKSARFAQDLLDNLDAIEYEDHQPPLYYMLAAPIFSLTDGNLTALRLFSAMWGVVIIVCAWWIGQMLYPERPWLGLGAAMFTAFVPQHLHILASVNNDALGWAIVALILALLTAYLYDHKLLRIHVRPWHLGVLVGVGLLTKTTTYMMAGVVPVGIVLKAWISQQENESPARPALFRQLVEFVVPALLLGGLWWLRSIIVYGFPDFLGLAAHDAVVVGQPRTADRIDTLGFGPYVRELAQISFESFWGKFGWMAVVMPAWAYTLIKVGLAGAASGWLLKVTVLRHRAAGMDQQRRAVWILFTWTALLAVLAFLYYNSEFQQYQGRYIFPLLIPLGFWLILGYDSWRQFGLRFVGSAAQQTIIQRALIYATVGVFALLALLDLYLIWRWIVPNLAP